MSERKKSQKGFVAVTLITLLAVALVLVVYATLLGTFDGGQVTVVALQGDVYYSLDNSTNWNSSLSNIPITDSWYVRFNVTGSDGYQGNVTITWALWNDTPTEVHTVASNFTLSGDPEPIYASSNGLQATNYNWGQNTTVADIYHIKVTIETAS